MADREIIGIELVAKLDQFRQEFKSLPKTTDDETKAAVGLALKNLSKLEKGAAKAGKDAKAGLKPASEGIKELGDTAGDTDSSLKALAGAVGLISPQAETALSSVGDLAGGIEGAVKAARLASVSLGAIGLAAAGIAAVAAVIYTVWTATEETRAKTAEWEAALKDVTTQTKTLASAQRALAGAGDDVAGFIGNLQIQTAVLRGEIDETDVKLGEMGSTLSDKLRPQLDEARKAYQEQGTQIYKLNEAIQSGTLSAGERVQTEIALNKAISNQDAIKGKIKAIKDLQVTGNEQINQYGLALRESAAKEEAAKEATKDRAAASKEAKEEVRDHAGVMRVLETSLGAASSAYEALSREEATSMAQLGELGATEEELALARERYAARRVELTQQTVEEVLALERGSNSSVMSAVSAYTANRLSEEEKLEAELLQVKSQIVADAEKAQADLNAIISTASAGGDLEAVRAAENAKIQIGKQTQAALTDASEEGALRRTELATNEARAQSEVIGQAVNQTIGDIGSAFAAYSTLMQSKHQETEEAISTASEAALKAQNEARERNGLAAIEMSEMVKTAEINALEEKQKKQKNIIIALFAAEQAAALAQVVIDTALGFSAVTAAYAANPPLMLGLQALVVASGVAQTAAISAARPFHTGGIVHPGGVGVGEVPARLLPGEVVMSKQAVGRMGGAASADRLNRASNMGGGNLVIEQRYGHRLFDEVVYDDIRRPDSSLRKAVSGRERVGHRPR